MIRSTKSQLEEFKESFLWADICDELNNLSRLAQLEYDLVGEPSVNDQGVQTVPNSSETLIHLGDIKGRRKAVNFFLSIPDILIQLVEGVKDEPVNNDEII